MNVLDTSNRSTVVEPVYALLVVLAGASFALASVGCSRSGVGLFDDDAADTDIDAGTDTNGDTSVDTDLDTPPDTMFDTNEPDVDFDVPPDNVCGDGFIGGNEECDDGNRRNGDGCDRRCRIEEVPDGMCVSDNDREIVESGFASDVAGECFNNCYFGGNDIDVACTSECMSDNTGMSGGCGDCYGFLLECIVLECLEICQFDERRCDECQNEICLPSFTECAGLGFP